MSTQSETLKTLSPFRRGKQQLLWRGRLLYWLRTLLYLTIAPLVAGFGLKSFLLPNSFIDGGVMGISLLVSNLTPLALPVLVVLINIPFIALGYAQAGRSFVWKSALAIGLLAVCLAVIPYPVITQDKLLVSVFGGFFIGAGIGLALRGGGVLDGTEVLAVYLAKRLGVTIGDVILVLNILIFSAAAILLNTEIALYSMFTYLSASKTVDFLVEGVEEYTGVLIVSSHSDEIRQMIIKTMGRGVTLLDGKRGYFKPHSKPTATDVVFTVVTRLEISKFKREIESIDPNAFVVMFGLKDIEGGLVKRRPMK